MGCHRNSALAGKLLLLLLLNLHVMDTQAALWGWFGNWGRKNTQDSDNDYGMRQGSSQVAFDLDTQQVLGGNARGKELYEKSTSLVSGHTCWQLAYAGMETSCRQILNDETKKSRLALRLTNCFLKTSGRGGIRDCGNDTPVASCVRSLDDHTHAIFLAFFIDAAAMCHYLQSEEFKFDTERAVTKLQESAHQADNRLQSINRQLETQHTQVMQHTGYILDAQESLEQGHALLQASIKEKMGKLQESADSVRGGLQDVHEMQKDVARQHQQLAEDMAHELGDLHRKSTVLGSSLGNLHGSIEQLTERSQVGLVEALKGLADLKSLQQDATEQSRADVKHLSEESQKAYEEHQNWQAQLGNTIEYILKSSSQITKAHEEILSKQAKVNELIMEVLNALMSLQKGWLVESRLLNTSVLYVTIFVIIFIVTTTKQTRSARLLLYIGSFLTLAGEYCLVRFDLIEHPSNESYKWPPKQIVWLRYGYTALALAFLLYTFFDFKDYKVLNYRMLKEMNTRQAQLEEEWERKERALNNRQEHFERSIEQRLAEVRKDVPEGGSKASRRTRFGMLPPKPPPSKSTPPKTPRRSHTSPY